MKFALVMMGRKIYLEMRLKLKRGTILQSGEKGVG